MKCAPLTSSASDSLEFHIKLDGGGCLRRLNDDGTSAVWLVGAYQRRLVDFFFFWMSRPSGTTEHLREPNGTSLDGKSWW